ncbi:MAG TPA: bacteriohemerythrin, partial [Leptospiraceae bacterium]|nr:bacteriohemerythrin [Leptospiraceae bacterium]
MIRNRMINLDQITIQETERFWKGGNFNLDISFIDIQHLWLVYLVLKIERTVSTSKSDVIENFSDFIVELDEYADVHFRIEEEMLEYFSFPGMRQHEEKHQAFESQISEFRSRESFSREEGEKVVRFLKNWLGTHILKEDKSYSDYFAKDKARLYDFSEELILSGKFSFTDEQKILYDRV